jgi:hypothetical protein
MEPDMTEISVFRLNLLRAGYLLLVVGLGITLWPSILDLSRTWGLMHGVVVSMLGAMSALAVLGLKYPLQMLPLLFFEMGWKTLWLLRVALPLWSADKLDAATLQTVYECLGVVIFPLIIPWPHVFRTYFKKAGDPWRRSRAANNA